MKQFKYLPLCALAASLPWICTARAQPPDAGQPRAGQPLTAEQAEQAQRAEQAKREEAQAARRRTPMGTLYQLATALIMGDLVLAARCIEGEPDRGALRRIADGLPGIEQFRVPSFDMMPQMVEPPEGKDEFEARVAIAPTLRDPLNLTDDPLLHSKATFIENITLRRGANGEWKVVPRAAPPVAPQTVGGDLQARFAELESRVKSAQSEADGFLNTWVRALAQPRALLSNTASRTSITNVKQLMLGMMQIVQDDNEKFDFTPANFQEKLRPYVKGRETFLAPILFEDKPFAYTLSPNIAGKNLAQFAEPARTVAIYEADKDGKPLFRFDGKAVIGFIDGHVKLTTPQEAEKLIWQP